MNTREIYINDVLIDHNEADSPIELVYAVNDLAELSDRQAYGTNTFKIPRTAKNDMACGLPSDAGLIQEQPYRRNTAKIVQSGIEIVPNGISVIQSSGDDFIEVQILGGLKGFFDTLGEKNIRELDLSDYDHIWNMETVANSQTRTDGYIYPVIDYGDMSNEVRQVEVRKLRPATFRKTIIERIIAEAGYTASGSYQAYEKFNKSIVCFSNDKFEHGASYAEELSFYNMSARSNIQQSIPFNGNLYQMPFQDDATTDQSGSWDGNVYTAQRHMKIKGVVKYTVSQIWNQIFGNPGDFNVRVSLKRSGGAFQPLVNNATLSTLNYQQETFADQVINFEIEVGPGDQIKMEAIKANNRIAAVIHAGASVEINPILEDVVYGSEVQLSATLPDVTQKNFFKDFLQNFGLIVIPDNYRKTLLMINMEDVYSNKPIAQDITEKLFDSATDVKYALPGYGIDNLGKYKADQNVPESLGQGSFKLDNLTLDNTVTLFTSIFAATETVNRLGGLFVPLIRKIESNDNSGDFKVKTEPRILLDQKVNSAGFEFYESETSYVFKDVVSIPTFSGLDYQSLFDENYPEIVRMLFRPFAVNKKIMLKEIDVANIDWRIPVYDAKSGAYYYKNKISYLQGGVSTISLIKLP